MNASYEYCPFCHNDEDYGLSRCSKCGVPLVPAKSAVQRITSIYSDIRTLALPGLQLSWENDDGQLYRTQGQALTFDVVVFIGEDWLGLNYLEWSMPLEIATFAQVARDWHSEVQWWRRHPTTQKIAIDQDHERKGRVCFLAGYDSSSEVLAVRSFLGGDWMGLLPRQH